MFQPFHFFLLFATPNFTSFILIFIFISLISVSPGDHHNNFILPTGSFLTLSALRLTSLASPLCSAAVLSLLHFSVEDTPAMLFLWNLTTRSFVLPSLCLFLMPHCFEQRYKSVPICKFCCFR